MSRIWAASSLRRRGWAAFVGLWLPAMASALLPAQVRAQGVARLLLFKGDAGAAAGPRRAQLAGRLGPLTDASALYTSAARGVPAGRIEPLREVEALLSEAHSQAAALAEHEALASLAEAARLCEQLGDVPGAALWNAEVQLRIGVTALQAEMPALAREAFRRAATLDPGRRLLAAEATPEAVTLYDAVKQQVAVAASGELTIRVDAPGAQVYIDDQPRGPAPLRVRASVGRHLLRVEASGYRAYGALIDVFEGVRPTLAIAPAPEPEQRAAHALARAAHAGDYGAVTVAVRELGAAGEAPDAVWVMELAPDGRRALLVRCDAQGCLGPARMRGVRSRWSLPDTALAPERLAEERTWLADDGHTTGLGDASEPPWWQRWYVWGGLAAAGGLAVAAIALGATGEPSGERQLRVVLEPEGLRLR